MHPALLATLDFLAQTTGPATRAAAAKPWWVQLFFESLFGPMAILLIVMWFFVIRGNKNKERQRQDMLASLKKGDKVQTIGGILGTVVEARDNEVLVKVDESANAKIWFVRSAIHKVRTDEKAQTK